MATSRNLLNDTLKSIATTKRRELEKRQTAYQARKEKILRAAKEQTDACGRVQVIHDSLKELKLWNDPEFHNIRCWTDQSIFDPIISQNKIADYERQLLNRLDIEERKLTLANLYSQLMIKCTDPNRDDNSSTPSGADTGEGDGGAFEMVETTQVNRLEQLKDSFAQVVFKPLETDEQEIGLYLRSLFQSDKGAAALHELQRAVNSLTSNLKELTIDRQHLIRSIKQLRANTMLSDSKKTILQEFLKDDAVLDEIKDVLNMRLQDIDNWSWDIGNEGIPVVPRSSGNGKWRIMMEEDVMQTLLTHFIGNQWAVPIKHELKKMINKKDAVWTHLNNETEDEKNRRLFFRPNSGTGNGMGVESKRYELFQDEFFLSPLPDELWQISGGYDDDDDEENDGKSGKATKQLLLNTLTSEVHLRCAFDGEVAVIQSDFQWFGTAMPHSTVFAALRFIGFDGAALKFVRKFLEPPLNMLDGRSGRVRKRGLPLANIFERLCGEIVLFFLDIAVNQQASINLYRLHDDLWLFGQPERCARAWTTVQRFTKVMGLELNRSKTGSVYLTLGDKQKVDWIMRALPDGPVSMQSLILDPVSGEWIINQEHVQQHMSRLSAQLSKTDNVLDWIATWNSCIGRFFGSTFGEPAQCLGRRHLEAVLQVHRKMQHSLFDEGETTGKNVVHHIRQMISSQLSLPESCIPDAFIFLPDDFGGLGLENPFIKLFPAREKLLDSPRAALNRFLSSERRQYEVDRQAFSKLDDRELHRRWKRIFSIDGDEDIGATLSWSLAKKFPEFEEYTRNREAISPDLAALYATFLWPSSNNNIRISSFVRDELRKVEAQARRSGVKFDASKWMRKHEVIWLLEHYRDDLIRDFGGMQCVEREFLPLGILHAVRQQKVTWQLAL